MGLIEQLGISPGVTSVVGSGGKTTLLAALAREVRGTCALTTTTHILPFEGVPTLLSPSGRQLEAALGDARVVCTGSPAGGGKLTAPEAGVEGLATVVDYVLVEADGSRRLPLKAHAAWEPVVPTCSARTVLVVGANGLGRPVIEAVHRYEIFCDLAGCAPSDVATPELVARALRAEGLADVVVINQADDPARIELARDLARLLETPAFGGSLRGGPGPHLRDLSS